MLWTVPSDASPEPPTPDERDTAPARRAGALEIRGSASGLLDDHILMRVRGAGPDSALTWRARYRDDDGRIWRAAASRCEDLATRWAPAKEGTGAVAALRSLRPVSIELRVEAADGRAADRTLLRRISGEGVRTRRWRDGLAATLHVPAQPDPCATVIVDATAAAAQATVATLAAPLLAARGVLVLVVVAARGRTVAADPLAVARERLSAVPGASGAILLLYALDPLDEDAAALPAASRDVILPPGIGEAGCAPGAPARGEPRDGDVILPAGVGEAGSASRTPTGGDSRDGDVILPAGVGEAGSACRTPTGGDSRDGDVILPPGVGEARCAPGAPTGGEPVDGAVVLPPGVGVRESRPGAAIARAAAWDALLHRLGARPRERPTVP
jgi:hypothetical protein